MTDRQSGNEMSACSLLVYGSLMDGRERARCGLADQQADPIILGGYRREFSQQPSWRRSEGVERGVLTVREGNGYSINAILLSGVPFAALVVIDERERGYVRRAVPSAKLSAFGTNEDQSADDPVFLYEGRPELHRPELQPNASYLEVCVAAASHWGESFRRMFLETTFADGQSLAAVGR